MYVIIAGGGGGSAQAQFNPVGGKGGLASGFVAVTGNVSYNVGGGGNGINWGSGVGGPGASSTFSNISAGGGGKSNLNNNGAQGSGSVDKYIIDKDNYSRPIGGPCCGGGGYIMIFY